MTLNKIKCLLGLHKWKVSGVPSTFPPPWEKGICTRQCGRCYKMQRWLPGYGGSEIGSWERVAEYPTREGKS